MTHFPCCFKFPPQFQKFFRLRGKFSQSHLFPQKFSIFMPQNFWWPYFSYWLNIFNFLPCFRYFNIFPSYFERENYYLFPPYFFKFPPWFRKFACFLRTLCNFPHILWPWCIYASHNARTGRPCLIIVVWILQYLNRYHTILIIRNDFRLTLNMTERSIITRI